MRNVNVFIASSLTELGADRMEIGAFFGCVNDACWERGVYFRVFICEDESVAMVSGGRKQEEYNEWLRNSDLALFVFRNNAGEFTREEFEVALKSRHETGRPAIRVYLRRDGDRAPQQNLLDFLSRLKREREVPCFVYEHIDQLKLSLLRLIQGMDMGISVSFDATNGKALVNGQGVLSLREIAPLSENPLIGGGK